MSPLMKLTYICCCCQSYQTLRINSADVPLNNGSVEYFCNHCQKIQTFYPEISNTTGDRGASSQSYSYRGEKLIKTKDIIKAYCKKNKLACRFVGTYAYIVTDQAEWFFNITSSRIKLYHSNTEKINRRTGMRADYHMQPYDFFSWRAVITYILRHDHQ